jgi:hypothetical protein
MQCSLKVTTGTVFQAQRLLDANTVVHALPQAAAVPMPCSAVMHTITSEAALFKNTPGIHWHLHQVQLLG